MRGGESKGQRILTDWQAGKEVEVEVEVEVEETKTTRRVGN
jgi:hypothetical protein